MHKAAGALSVVASLRKPTHIERLFALTMTILVVPAMQLVVNALEA